MTRQHWAVAACLWIAGLGITGALVFLRKTAPSSIVPFQVSDAVPRYEADRETWNRPSDVIGALALDTGGTVADVGAGTGYFTLKLSRTVGSSGAVYAVDINPSTVSELQARVAAGRLTNVKVSLGRVDDPGLPAGALDAVLISDAYHEMVEHKAILRGIRLALKPTGRLVILEKMAARDEGKPRDIQTRNHHIAMSTVESELAEAGFSVVDRIEHFAEVPAAYSAGMLWRLIAVRK
jgi:ubiquinone/menaquinone biosynthesis C-methylase UbiE